MRRPLTENEAKRELSMKVLIRSLVASAALATASLCVPAQADTNSVPPGNPCLKNNGNPCKGNNGNLGDQGNVGHEKVKIDKKPPSIDIAMPPVTDRGVFITQVGDSNEANAIQTAPNAFASIHQDGNSNDAEVAQTGSGSHYVAASQSGDENFARIEQSGSGENVLYATQNGNGNWMRSNQVALGAIHNGAIMAQTGNDNDMSLYQEGSDNLAILAQEGDENGMTAVQLGEGNRLAWTQQGDNLSDLQITQTGGSETGGQLMITQTNVGNGN
jgi:hypothetical protein